MHVFMRKERERARVQHRSNRWIIAEKQKLNFENHCTFCFGYFQS